LVATLNVTVPLPVPLVRPVTEIHDVSVPADHSHDGAAVTEIELLLVPDARIDTSFGVTVTLQSAVAGGGTGTTGGGTEALACCVIFTVWPATTIDAARVVVPGFDAIVNVTLPAPVPVDPPVSTTHPASD
jgi:citrate lyase alpha subunit